MRTADLRARVLAAWAASPARFREDANAEEDFALGGYRDRVVIELAQNAADAAARAGAPGRLRLTLRDGVLEAANTGAPLSPEGVQALSTLRASAKRGDPHATGRFGIGFSAVVAVTDTPAIHTRPSMGVMWSAERTRALVAAIPELAEELARRGGAVPILRLPFPADGIEPADGLDTVVRLPLRDSAAEEAVRRQLGEVGPALLLALPALEQVEVDVDGVVRTLVAERSDGAVTVDGVRWRTAEAHGALDPALLADRPTEERDRPFWWVRWAVPDVPDHPFAPRRSLPDEIPAVVHAPTPSDERVGLPALLLASFPLATDRRHVAPGPLTDFLVQRAADAYADLVAAAEPSPRLLDLVPGPVADGELDAHLRRAILHRLPEIPLLPVLEPPDAAPEHPAGRRLVRGRDAVAVDGPGALLELLAEVVPGLLPPGWPVRSPELAALGVRRLELADVVDALAGLEREPGWWRRLYEALAGVGSEALGALPVPLADGGRLVRGPNGLLLAADSVDPETLKVLELRFVHPQAAHPLLMRLGAVEAGPRAVLDDPRTRAAVEGSFDADEPEAVAEAVLGLVAAARIRAGEEPWLAELALAAEDGELYPAGELLLPGAPLAEIMADDAPFGTVADDLVARYGAEALEAAGVLGGFAVARAEEVALSDLAFDLDGEEDWVREVSARLPDQDLPPHLPEFVAVRDLELVADWAKALELLARPPLREALTTPAHVVLGDGRRVAVPSYTAWWLRRHPVMDGRSPGELRPSGADPLLEGLYDPAPAELDPELLKALGVRTSVAELLAEPGGADELLDRLADPARTVGRDQLRALWRALADHGPTVPPDRVRAVVDGVVEVVPAADALVLDDPALLPLLRGQPLVIGPYDQAHELAESLDLPRASEEFPGTVESAGTPQPVPAVVRRVLAGAPETYTEHAELVVDGQPVPWWDDPDTGPHVVAGDPAALARALAWAADQWEARLLAEAVLRDPAALSALEAERDLEL